jgi:hypothetical protein
MSDPHLPPELLDNIVDLLHDQPETLRRCSLVAKSWVPRARKHLFADVKFDSAFRLDLWKKTFLDPSNSPARYTHSLFVGCSQVVTEADAEEGGWIRTFSRVSRLAVEANPTGLNGRKLSLVPFCKFSPTIKSLRLSFLDLSQLQAFNLIHSLPPLEDLALVSGCSLDADEDPHGPQTVDLSTSPAFTGTLDLLGIKHFAYRLLSLPSGIHFRKLRLTWSRVEDSVLTTALVEECAHTLESLNISDLLGMSIRHLHPH